MYCRYCGKQLKDGEVCSCRKSNRPPGAQNQTRREPSPSGRHPRSAGQRPANQRPAGQRSTNHRLSQQQGINWPAVVSLIFALGGLLVFIVLRTMGESLFENSGEFIYDNQALIVFGVPLILVAIAFVLAGISLQAEAAKTMSYIMLAVSILFIVIIIASGFIAPYGKEGPSIIRETESETERQTETKAPETEESETPAETEDIGTINQMKALVSAYQSDHDYVAAKQKLNDLLNNSQDPEKLKDQANSVQKEIEGALRAYFTELISGNKLVEAYDMLADIIEQLPEDTTAKSLWTQYSSEYVQAVADRAQELINADNEAGAFKLIGEALERFPEDSDLKQLKNTLKKENETDETEQSEDYILPQSDSKYLTSADVTGLTLKEVNYAKNEIFARHGRLFNSNELQTYFNSKTWYNGTISSDSFDAKVLNEYESANVKFLTDLEFSMSSSGYILDQ